MGAAFTLFDSAIGRCGLAWWEEAVLAFVLPGADDEATSHALTRRIPEAERQEPSAFARTTIDAVRRLLAGDQPDLRSIKVDLDSAPPFERRVYDLLRQVGPGETITYGELAARAGSPGAARAVGAAMARNPVPVIIPCHRVLAGGGRSGGFSAPGGVSAKFRLLQIEQAGKSPGLLFGELPLALSPSRGGNPG